MHSQLGFSLKSHVCVSPPNLKPLQNPRMSPSAAGRNLQYSTMLKCRGIGIQGRNSLSCVNGVEPSAEVKDIDLATLGNLCVDIVLDVPKLPPETMAERKAYMEELAKSPPDKEFWEAGGNCNVVIAAARLGLRSATIGHVGDETYGRFLLDVLRDEGISMVDMNDPNDDVDGTLAAAYETLLCWVLVDPLQRHGFCSRADFSNSPAFCWIQGLSMETKMTVQRSKIIFCNGFGFDELSPSVLMSVLDYAVEVGTAIFFDPGLRGKFLINGSDEEQMALDKYSRMSDVLLLSSEEAESLTGIEDPILAGRELLRKGIRTDWVIIKIGSRGSILMTQSSISCAPAFKVDAVDTVGCGDSYVAAIAFSYVHKMPSISTLTIANAVGGATAMGCGAGRNVANLKQTVEIVSGLNLNEDNGFWEELLKEHLDAEEITLLTGDVIDENDNKFQRALLQKSARELLPLLEHARAREVGCVD